MRRVLTTILAISILQAVFPRPAHAWWDYIEQLSGPGPLRGFDIEARLLCFVRQQDSNQLVRAAVVGGIVNFCNIPRDQRRVLSFDFGVRYVRRSDDPRFAGGEPISLMTFEPSVTWNFIPSPKFDFVEAGFGTGSYWFHSRGFDDFTGMVVDTRLDFRVPRNYQGRHWFLRPLIRFGVLTFPGGFDEAQFAAAPGVMIHERSSKYLAFFWDINGN